MATSQNNVPMSKKDQVKALRREVAPYLVGVLAAESLLLDKQIEAAPRIAALIGKSGNPSQRIRLNRGTEDESTVHVTFRKIGDYVGDENGVPVKTNPETGEYPKGSKTLPIYGVKVAEDDDDNDD